MLILPRPSLDVTRPDLHSRVDPVTPDTVLILVHVNHDNIEPNVPLSDESFTKITTKI